MRNRKFTVITSQNGLLSVFLSCSSYNINESRKHHTYADIFCKPSHKSTDTSTTAHFCTRTFPDICLQLKICGAKAWGGRAKVQYVKVWNAPSSSGRLRASDGPPYTLHPKPCPSPHYPAPHHRRPTSGTFSASLPKLDQPVQATSHILAYSLDQ